MAIAQHADKHTVLSFGTGGQGELGEVEPHFFPASPDGAPEGEKSPKRDQNDSFLALYFREMAPLPVLKPEQEFEAARQIEDLEVSLWTHLLSYPAATDRVLRIVEQGLENVLGEFASLRRAAGQVRGATDLGTRRRYEARCAAVARRIHAIDVDRRILAAVMREIVAIARKEQGARYGKRLMPAGTRAVQVYCRRGRILFGEAQRARNEFVKSNLRLVVSIARRFDHGRMPLNDLIQEGNIGLIKAVERYDYRRGYRFSTYASWWIRHSISRALADKGRAVRLPVHMLDAYHKVMRASRELASKLGRPPTAEEIGFSAGLPQDKVERIQGFLLEQALSLDRTVSGEDDRKFIELLQDPNGLSPTDKIADESVTRQVREILYDLRPIEADVLAKRFGLAGSKEHTLKEIGDGYRLSRERIRQIQEQALGKIRRALQRRNVL
jgi:RNA polymerase primary sigma factor